MTGTYKYKDIIVTIDYDEYGESPREWSNLATMVCSHRRYNLGDEQAKNISSYDSWQEWSVKELPEDAIALPLYLYEHSGLSISTAPLTSRWDSGQVGYIYMTEQDMQEYDYTEEQAIEYMKAEVNTYNKYLTGEVYTITVERLELCESCNHTYKVGHDSVGSLYLDQASDIIEALYGYFSLSDDELEALTPAITGEGA